MGTLNVSKTFFSKLFAPSDGDFFFLQGIASDGIGNSKQNVQHGFHKKNYFFWSEVNYDFKLREDEKMLLSLHLSPSYKLFFSASK